MKNKRIIISIVILGLLACAVGIFLIEKEVHPVKNEQKASIDKPKPQQTNVSEQSAKDNPSQVIKADLYSNSSNYLPLIAITETANLSPALKQKVDAVLELSQGCYYLKQNPNTKEIFIILQNPAMYNGNRYARHGLQIAKLSTNGVVTYTNLGFNGEENEIENANLQQKTEEWVFDDTETSYKPLKHTSYDKKRKISYTETWNYNEDEPVKYEMKDGNDRVVSIMKETFDGDSGYRREHIFYDEDGNTLKSLTVDYNGADVKWFTYYDAKSPENSIMIESAYNDGLKTEEKIYNQNFQLEKTLTSNYVDGERTNIKVNDSEGNEILNIENK